MKLKKVLFILLSLCCLFVLSSCSSSDDNDNPISNGGPVGLDKVRLADAQAKALHPLAKIVWAGGRLASGGTMNDPAAADTWDFNAVADDGSSQLVGIWQLILLNSQWIINQLQYPPMEIEYIDLTSITMDVSDAWQLVIDAGLSRPFFTWELLKSLHPDYPNPFYAFYVGNGQYLFVDIVTRTPSLGGNAPGTPAGNSIGAYNSTAALGSTPGTTDGASIAMISAASARIKANSPAAAVVWVQGTSAMEAMSNPGETDAWSFIAVDESQPLVPSWDIWSDSNAWTITERQFPPSGILFMDLTGIWMDVTAAWSLVEANGLAQRFSTWELSFIEDGERPLFIFRKITGGNIYVDAISGQAWED